MGTHPIFESDFDCLTDLDELRGFELIKDDSIDMQAQIINYQSLSDSHLNNNVENLDLPLSGKMKFEKETYELNMEQFESNCVQLNAALQNNTYLVGDKLSIADSTVAVCLKPAFENILGDTEREKYPNIVRWYLAVSSDEKLKKHLKTQMTKERKVYDAKEVAGKLAKEEEKARKKAEKEAKFAAKKAAQEAAKAQKGSKPAKDA